MSRGERPSIEDLRALVAVYDNHTLSAAAGPLGVTQPVVHGRLSVFRKCSRPLIETIRQQVKFTEAGEQALPTIRAFLRQYEQIKAFVNARRAASDATCIAMGSSTSQFYLAPAIASLRAAAAGFQLQTRVVRGKERVAGVVRGAFDLGIVSHSQAQIEVIAQGAGAARGDLVIQDLVRLPLCVIARVGTSEGDELQSLLAGQDFPLQSLAGWRLAGLDRESGIRQQLEGMLSRTNQKLEFADEAGGWLGVKELAKQGLCVGIVPLALMTPGERNHLVIRRLDRELSISHRLIHREDAICAGLKPVKAAFLAAARQHEEEVDRRWYGLL